MLAVVHAEDFLLGDFHRHHGKPGGVGLLHRIGEVILPLGIGVADALEQPEAVVGAKAHHTAVAQLDRQFLWRGVLGLADRPQAAVFHQQPAVGAWLFAREAGDRHGRAVDQGLPQARQRLCANQRRVAEQHQHAALFKALQRRPSGQHRMGGTQALMLHECPGARRELADILGHLWRVRPDHHGQLVRSGGVRCREHVAEQRPVADLVHHLGQGRTHARALPRREDHRKRGKIFLLVHSQTPQTPPNRSSLQEDHRPGSCGLWSMKRRAVLQ
ncbi:hypothetical protein D9M70_493540 [compost metagenome]